MSFKLAVETFSGRLTDSDRTLVSIILSDPSQVVFYSAHELANQAGVHASTVVRLARKLGFDGFPGMRKALQKRNQGGVRAGRTGQTTLEQGRRKLESVHANTY